MIIIGLKLKKVKEREVKRIEKFFTESSIDEFREFFPVEMADFATETFKKKEYFYVAKINDNPVGAMYFSIQGGVGQLAAIQVDKELSNVKQKRMRIALLEKFIEICNKEMCHLAYMWIPHQYKKTIGVYYKRGFRNIFTAKDFWYKNDFILLVKKL